MSEKRICAGTCGKFRVSRPLGGGRYQAGQGRCQTCDIWLDHRGAHTKDGEPASADSEGWFCNCCNYRIRRNPRNIEYKAKMRSSDVGDGHDIDLSYFNKRRANMLRELGRAIVQKDLTNSRERYESFLPNAIPAVDIELEFGVGLDVMIKLARQVKPPNKVSMITEFERVRHVVKHTPTRQDIEENSVLRPLQYDEEFGSWEHLLERLGYDPWYRNYHKSQKTDHGLLPQEDMPSTEKGNTETLDDVRNEITSRLRDEPDMLSLFGMVDRNISKLTTSEIKSLISSITKMP